MLSIINKICYFLNIEQPNKKTLVDEVIKNWFKFITVIYIIY